MNPFGKRLRLKLSIMWMTATQSLVQTLLSAKN